MRMCAFGRNHLFKRKEERNLLVAPSTLKNFNKIHNCYVLLSFFFLDVSNQDLGFTYIYIVNVHCKNRTCVTCVSIRKSI